MLKISKICFVILIPVLNGESLITSNFIFHTKNNRVTLGANH